MDGRSWLPLVFGGAEQLQAEAGWRHTFMVEYSGGGAPEAAEGSEVDAEAGWEASHWCKRHRHSHKDALPHESSREFTAIRTSFPIMC